MIDDILAALAIDPAPLCGESGMTSRSPIDGSTLARVPLTSIADLDGAVARAVSAQRRWQSVPAPRRGELVRRYGNALRDAKDALGMLVTLETGKLLQEGLGEVQEMIDICDFAVGLSRQLHGLTIASERPDHRMLETWHPYGVCGVVSAFNFPVAVWAWNAALALACGNAVVWKPSEKTPLCAWAAHALLRRTLDGFDASLADIAQLAIGDRALGARLVEHPDVRLVSATGSTAMGRAVGEACARQFKRTILELGGNNAAIVCPSADLDLATRAIVVRGRRHRGTAMHHPAPAVRARVAARHVRRTPARRSTRASASATRASRAPSSGRSSTAARSTPCKRRSRRPARKAAS